MELDFEVNYSHHRNQSESTCREEKIELSRVNNIPASSFRIIDSLCSSDEDSEQNMPPVNEPTRGPQEQDTPFNLLKSLSSRFGGVHSPAKAKLEIDQRSRFSPVRKMFDPFVKSKSSRNRLIRKSEEKENRNSAKNSSPAHLHGLLKVGSRRGASFFEFLVKSTGDVYVAKTRKDENALTCVYTFYSLRKWRTSNSETSSLVGWMHVSCRPLVTEFVLHDIIHSRKSASDKMIRDQLITKRSSENEIAAVVMQDIRQLGEGISDVLSGVKMHVLIPAGNHGLPISGGPTRLLDRWRLGGGCDCGGWDMACTLDVFSNLNFKIADLADNRNPAQLCSQDKRDNIPAFSMTGIGDGKYEVDFHARLSSLQAFSISVAMLHAAGLKRSSSSQQMSQMDSRTSCAKEMIESTMDALAKEEEEEEEKEEGEEIYNIVNKKEQVMSSFVLNPPFSPIARV